ncbi:ABC transporter permease [Microbacterium sp. X-17]|uniref:ABC transporter permease n=1 Tax=Microbacterium sp. X-17 TaxID=3144404 RepID=UPI0031F4E321
MPPLASWLPWAVCVALLALVGVVVLRLFRIASPLAGLFALLRGTAQLIILSVILSGVITSLGWVALAVAVTFGAAVFTATRRIGLGMGSVVAVTVAMLAGVAVSLGVVFLTGAVEFNARYVLAMAGIVIGNTMTVAALGGTHLRALVTDRWTEVEAWLTVGASPRRAARDFARLAASRAIIPGIDQTKTTGLVVLPGAFVGAIFGGLSPLEAGRFQIVVLAAIVASSSIVSTLLTSLLRSRAVARPEREFA